VSAFQAPGSTADPAWRQLAVLTLDDGSYAIAYVGGRQWSVPEAVLYVKAARQFKAKIGGKLDPWRVVVVGTPVQ